MDLGPGSNVAVLAQASGESYERWLSVSEDTFHSTVAPNAEQTASTDPQSQFLFAKCRQFGIGGPVDETEAFRFYEMSAKQGFPPAQFMLALCYELGVGAPKKPKSALQNFQLAAANGLVRAQTALDRYSKTEKPPPAQKNCNKEAQLLLAHYFRSGPENLAFKHYMTSALQDHPEGAMWVALSLFHGLGVKRDQETALLWYKRAAEKGLTVTQTMLGLCNSFCGRAVTPEENKLVSVLFQELNEKSGYEQRAQAGGQTFINLAKCFMAGRGVSPNQNLADRYYKLGAEATFKLACCYEFGVGVEEDQAEAFKCYQEAADLDHVPAYAHLGLCYLHGLGVPKNIPMALSAIQTGVQLGNPQATYLLASFYEEGRGVPKNIDTAMNYYSKAAHCGVPQARTKLEQLLLCSD